MPWSPDTSHLGRRLQLLVLGVLVPGLLLVSWSVPANAQRRSTSRDIQKAQEHVDRGDGFFDQKRYDEAIAEYTTALVLAPHPDLVWNIARAHEELERLGQAIALFRRYKTMFVGAGDKTEADGKITSLNKRLRAKRVGSIVVMTPSPTARVLVGGTAVGRGEEVIVDLKPGRYRVRVELEDHDPFERVVTVGPADRVTVKAMPKLIKRLSVLIVRVEIPGARVSVDGGASVDSGLALQVRAGEHTIRVTADNRDPVETVLQVPAAETTEVVIEMGPLRHPDRFESWEGQYLGLAPAENTDAARFVGSTLTIDGANLEGTLVAVESRALEPWRRSHCKGAERLSWTTTYRARLHVSQSAANLELDRGAITACSCTTWCKVVADARIDLRPLPGREGLIGPVTFVRDGLRDNSAAAWKSDVHPSLLSDEWEVLTWRGDSRPDDRLFLGKKSHLRRKLIGQVPSWKRSACGASDYQQVATYAAVPSVNGREIALAFEAPAASGCSCTGACGAPPLMAVEPLRLLVFTRYLVGDGTLLRRVRH